MADVGRIQDDQAETRSVGSVVTQYLQNVEVGAGLMTGGLIAKGAWGKITGGEKADKPEKK